MFTLPFIEQAVTLLSDVYELQRVGELPHARNVEYWTGRIGGVKALVIPGTNSLQDVLTDLKFWPRELTYLTIDCDVHAGFYALAMLIRKQVREYDPDVIIGHSLGGAVAQLLGLTQAYPTLTFGQPRTGDAQFARLLDPERHVRVVHRADPVPHVPSWWCGYHHGGRLIKIGQRASWFGYDRTAHWPPAYQRGVAQLKGI